jgi:hypothetical protein
MNPLNIVASPESIAIVTFLCVAVVKLVDELFNKDWRGAAKIAGSAVVGLIAGHFVHGVGGLDGLAIGLSASGLITGLSFVGSVSPAAPVAAMPVPAVPAPAADPAAMPIHG